MIFYFWITRETILGYKVYEIIIAVILSPTTKFVIVNDLGPGLEAAVFQPHGLFLKMLQAFDASVYARDVPG